MATESDSKKLTDLRVVHLRAELEKRDLDKTGVKVDLIQRLHKALVDEGKDPEVYEFDLSDKKTSKMLSLSARPEENNVNADQDANDSSVLMIDTPSLDTVLDSAQETTKEDKIKDVKGKNDNTESPLNLSIKEEEVNMLMNSGDEQEMKIIVDDMKNELEIIIKKEDNTDDEANDDADAENQDTLREDSRSDSSKNENSTTNEVSSTTKSAAPVSSTALQSEKDPKIDKENVKINSGRSLWVTNILPSTRAQELKHLLARFGKVIGAKVVQSSLHSSQRCYGYVTMETSAAADLCIEKLNNTELEGQIIRVAKVRPEHSLPMKAQKEKETPKEKEKKKEDSPQKNGSEKPAKKKVASPVPKKKVENKKENKAENKVERDSKNTNIKKNRSHLKSSINRKSEILKFDKIRAERERRERERVTRKEKKQREIQRAREIEKQQREEDSRLEREREKLRIERERLDRQRAEIMRLERERQRLEREKLEQEKQELRRQQMRLEEARKSVKRPSTATPTLRREDDRKRSTSERRYDDTPPPPRFEISAGKKESTKLRLSYSKRAEEYPKRSDFKREYPVAERHSSGHSNAISHSSGHSSGHPNSHAISHQSGHPVAHPSEHSIAHPSHTIAHPSGHSSGHSSGHPSGHPSSKYNSPTYINRERERDREMPNILPARISKETRHSDRSPVSYRSMRDERDRRQLPEHHPKPEIRLSREHRYMETALKEGVRYRENSWHSSDAPATVKPFSGLSEFAGSSRESWSKADNNWRPIETNDIWGNSSSRLILPSSSSVTNNIFSGGNSNMSGIGLNCPPSPGISSYSLDRFDTYNSINNMRKY